jgi:hypothetical protein
MIDVSNLSKRQLYDLVIAHRDAGTLTGKMLKKIRSRAKTLLFETARGNMWDLDLAWIAAGCPAEKELIGRLMNWSKSVTSAERSAERRIS